MVFPDLEPWIARLKAECQVFLGSNVFGAVEYAAARAKGAKMTRAYVMPMRSASEPLVLLGGAIQQEATDMVEVLMAVRNDADIAGGEAAADVMVTRNQVLDALNGWQPINGGIVLYRSGQRIGFDDFTVWWSDVYSYDYRLTR